jgi:ABC-2 type transport system ATP-binding protein
LEIEGIMFALEAKNLVKEFGKSKSRAVDNVSFAIKPGEKVAIVGPNGAGKTTTIMMALGLIEPTSGSALIFGDDPKGRNVKSMEQVGFCAGYANFRTDRKVFQILKYNAMLYGIENPDRAVEEILLSLDIKHLSNKRTKSLSSGQGTLISVAKALVHKPKIVIMDEPTAFTDPEVSQRIQDILSEYNEKFNMTVVITSHDMQEVERICGRVIFIAQGKVVMDATPNSIRESTGHKTLEEAWLSFAKEHEKEFTQEEEI